MPLSKDQNGRVYMADILGNEDDAREVAERAREVVDKAKAALAAYTKNTSPMPGEQADLAAHAIRLAKLDPLCRARVFDATFDEAAQEDVEDLVAMLAIVPFERLLHETVLLLNPTFGEASQAVRGADTDLIAGDMLIDFKTTTKTAMEGEYLDQILGYFFLARREQRVNPKFPEIKRLGIYFCRHGFLWTIEAKTWTDCPVFPEVEEWFFQRAGEVFGTSRPATKPRKKKWGPRTSRCTPAKDHEASCGIASGRQSRQLKLGLRRRSGSRGNTWTQPGKMRSTL